MQIPRNQFLALAVLCLLVLWTNPALSVAPGSGHGGCCGVPPGLENRARQLEQSFAKSTGDTLAQQRWAGTLCENHPCADDVTEAQAKGLLESWAAREQRRADAELVETQRRWDGFQKIVLGVIAFGGLFLGLLNRYRPRS